MKAIVHTKYGNPDVLQMQNLDVPEPKLDEVLIKVHATSVSSGDARMRRADPWIIRLIFGLRRLRKPVMGYTLSGEIVKTGADVNKFSVGDIVYATTGMRMGAYAEYAIVAENGVIANKPTKITHDQAAALPFGGTTALYFLRKGGIASGQNVLIYGASGAIGSAAVQLAKHFGAHVTAVNSGKNVALVQSIGADEVIDYTKEDFASGTKKYDLIFDTVGKIDYGKAVSSLKKTGRFVFADGAFSTTIKSFVNKRVIGGVIKETAADLEFFNSLIEADKFTPVIDRSYPLEQISKAHAYVDTGHKVGSVVITV